MILTPGYDLEVKVTENFHIKVKIFAFKFIYLYHQDLLLNFFIPQPIGLGDIAISMESICPSIHLSVHRRIIVHPIPPIPFKLFFHETLSGCRGHWVGVSSTRMTALTDLVHESPKLSTFCVNHNFKTLQDIFMILH